MTDAYIHVLLCVLRNVVERSLLCINISTLWPNPRKSACRRFCRPLQAPGFSKRKSLNNVVCALYAGNLACWNPFQDFSGIFLSSLLYVLILWSLWAPHQHVSRASSSSLAWVKQKDTWQRLWAPGSRKSGCSQGSKIEGSLKWPIYWESSRNIFQICGSDQIIRYFWKCHKKRNHLRDAGIYYMDVSETGIFAQMSALMGKMMETVVKHDQSQ